MHSCTYRENLPRSNHVFFIANYHSRRLFLFHSALLRELELVSTFTSTSMSMSMFMPMSMSYNESPTASSGGTPAATVTSTPVSAPTRTVIVSPGTGAPQVDPSGTAAPIDSVATSPTPTPAPQVAPQVAPTGTSAPIDSMAASPSPTFIPQLPRGTAPPIDSVPASPSPTPAPTGGVDLGLSTPAGGVDQGLSSANQPENSGDASGPDTSQTILFIVAAFAAVAVGAALMARKFAIGAGASSSIVSVDSAPSQAPAADGRLMDVELGC
jgi:hypothetical protein